MTPTSPNEINLDNAEESESQGAETLTILYQDEALIAVHKPAGLLVHKSPIDRHEKRYAMKLLRNQLGQWVYPVHRLDKPTSGLLLFALNQDMANKLSLKFEHREVSKTYHAIVRGIAPESIEIDHPLKEIAAFKSQQAEADLKDAKDAQTSLQRLKCYELPFADGRFNTSRYSLVKLSPGTGRKHQLRRHMKHISHPIVGDVKYGKGNHNRIFREHFNCQRLFLAATNMSFNHPETNIRTSIDCPIEEDFAKLLGAIEQYQMSPE